MKKLLMIAVLTACSISVIDAKILNIGNYSDSPAMLGVIRLSDGTSTNFTIEPGHMDPVEYGNDVDILDIALRPRDENVEPTILDDASAFYDAANMLEGQELERISIPACANAGDVLRIGYRAANGDRPAEIWLDCEDILGHNAMQTGVEKIEAEENAMAQAGG